MDWVALNETFLKISRLYQPYLANLPCHPTWRYSYERKWETTLMNPRISHAMLAVVLYCSNLEASPALAAKAIDGLPAVAENAISDESDMLAKKARFEGHVPVLVILNDNSIDEGLALNPNEADTKQKQMESQQKTLLAEIPIHRTRSIKHYSHLPLMAMSADETEIRQLQASHRVVQVVEDHANLPFALDLSIATIAANAGWASGYTGAGQTIAVLDNGIDKRNPLLLNDKIVAEACFSTRDSNNHIRPLCRGGRTSQVGSGSATVKCKFLDLDCTHGTLISAIAAGNSLTADFAGSGVAPQARIIAIKVASLSSSSKTCAPAKRCQVFYDSDLLRGLNLVYRLRRRLNIASINMSLGADATQGECNGSPLKRIIAKLRAAKIATIAASGNEGFRTRISSPACIPGVVSVGATNAANAVWALSNSAANLSLLAPGVGISLPMPGVLPEGYVAVSSGTSLSAAFVSGAWAALKSHKPSATVGEILSALTNTGIPIFDPRNKVVKPLIQIGRAHSTLSP